MIELLNLLILALTTITYIGAVLFGLYATGVFALRKFRYAIFAVFGMIVLTAVTAFCLLPLLRMHGSFDTSERLFHMLVCLIDFSLIVLFTNRISKALASVNKTDASVAQ